MPGRRRVSSGLRSRPLDYNELYSVDELKMEHPNDPDWAYEFFDSPDYRAFKSWFEIEGEQEYYTEASNELKSVLDGVFLVFNEDANFSEYGIEIAIDYDKAYEQFDEYFAPFSELKDLDALQCPGNPQEHWGNVWRRDSNIVDVSIDQDMLLDYLYDELVGPALESAHLGGKVFYPVISPNAPRELVEIGGPFDVFEDYYQRIQNNVWSVDELVNHIYNHAENKSYAYVDWANNYLSWAEMNWPSTMYSYFSNEVAPQQIFYGDGTYAG